MTARQKRKAVAFLRDQYRVSVRRSCGLVVLRRQMWYYRLLAKGDQALRMRIREITESRVRYGFWRIYTLLRREGCKDNHKRVYRVYCDEKVKSPVIVMHGDKDDFIFYGSSIKLQDHFKPDDEFITIKGGLQHIHHENEQVHAELERILLLSVLK